MTEIELEYYQFYADLLKDEFINNLKSIRCLKQSYRGRQVNLSEEKAEKIIKWKEDKISPDTFIDLGLKNYVALGQVKQVVFDERDVDQQLFDMKHEEYLELIRDWNDYVKKCVKEDVDTKARRMTRSGCFLLWKARMNKNGILKDLYEKLMFKLIPYFENNKFEWWASRENYQDLIPYSEPSIKSEATGWKALGELIK